MAWSRGLEAAAIAKPGENPGLGRGRRSRREGAVGEVGNEMERVQAGEERGGKGGGGGRGGGGRKGVGRSAGEEEKTRRGWGCGDERQCTRHAFCAQGPYSVFVLRPLFSWVSLDSSQNTNDRGGGPASRKRLSRLLPHRIPTDLCSPHKFAAILSPFTSCTMRAGLDYGQEVHRSVKKSCQDMTI